MYLFTSLIVLFGLGLLGFLWSRFRRPRARAVVFLLWSGLGLAVAYVFLPCFHLFGPSFCEGSSVERVIALSFDDGPNEPYTSQILDVLKFYQVPATFFPLGKNIERSPGTIARILAEGHPIGNHTYDHHPLIFRSKAGIEEEVKKWEEVMRPFGPISPRLFRAPHGWKSPFLLSLLERNGYHLVGWTIGVWDSDRPGAEVLLGRLLRRVRNGAILLLHDGGGTTAGADRSQTVALLPKLIEECSRRGYRFVTVSQILKF